MHTSQARWNESASAHARRPLAAALLWLAAVGLGAGCSTTFNDTHYFRSVSEDGRSTNYFRLRINGSAQFSSARYVSGYYDERAVDLFFNELRSGAAPNAEGGSGAPDRQALFTGMPEPEEGEPKIEPLDPGTHGAFVMILSTDATAVANAIGQFSESNIVAESISNLLNRDRVAAAREQQARQSADAARTAAVAAELEGIVTQVPAAGGASPEEMEQAQLRTLNVIGAALGRQTAFASFAEADAWLQARRSVTGGQAR